MLDYLLIALLFLGIWFWGFAVGCFYEELKESLDD